ncbi:tyrosine-type recombinase/integrase [bacterium]
MLTNYYTDPHRVEQLRSGPVGPYQDGFTAWLAKRGYKRSVIRTCARCASNFSDWLCDEGLSVENIDEKVLRLYWEYLQRLDPESQLCESRMMDFRRSAGHLLTYLRSIGVAKARTPEDDWPALVREFREWCRRHRGIAESTLKKHSNIICDFIKAAGDNPELYCAENVRGFFFERSKGMSGAGTHTVASSTRVFLRFLIAMGKCPPGLDAAIPPVANWRLSTLPRYIDAEDVEKIIASCDAGTATGARDKAIILLLARLGLRAGDVAALKLDDLDWRAGKVLVSGKARKQTWLPLPQEVGKCISQYLVKWRPGTDCRSVFITMYAPFNPVSRGVVTSVVGTAIRRAGVNAPSHGAHLLRHSFATEMLKQGVSLDDIGTILRHSNVESTAHYAKVDFEMLKEVVMPWPVEVSPC